MQDAKDALLVHLSGPDIGCCHAVGSRDLHIGRAPRAVSVFTDGPFVSHDHCRIFRGRRGAFWVEDLGSKNGTFVNGRAVRKKRLRHGDLISVAHEYFKLVDSSTPEADYHRAIFDLAARDPETAALSRRRFERLLELELTRAAGKFTLLMVQVNPLRALDEGPGHPGRVAALSRLAGVVGRVAGRGVEPARFDLDTIGALLPAASRPRALLVAHAIGTAMARSGAGGPPARRTVSVGGIVYDHSRPAMTRDALVQSALGYLREAKARGGKFAVCIGPRRRVTEVQIMSTTRGPEQRKSGCPDLEFSAGTSRLAGE